VAQLGARLDGIEEVVGSNPIGSTKFCKSLFITCFHYSDYYTQPENLFRLMPADAKQRLIDNIVSSLGMAKGLGLNIESVIAKTEQASAAD
jgi:hypothetical protein